MNFWTCTLHSALYVHVHTVLYVLYMQREDIDNTLSAVCEVPCYELVFSLRCSGFITLNMTDMVGTVELASSMYL